MGAGGTTKRHSAILIADVVGYSRLMAGDLDSTVETLRTYRSVFSQHIADQHGWVVNTPGDSILAEFNTASEAVQSAKRIQDQLDIRNGNLPGDRKMFFRIGISEGDVVAEENAIYGDEVNIAARLESLADPGGICISSIAYSNVEGKLDLKYEYMGEHQLKNIARLVPVYRVYFGGGDARSSLPSQAIARLNKPSIAVLPFANLSPDAEQEYFADGITEDIITELSRFKSLFVIARNSTFAYKGQAVHVQRVGRDLGVQYVLEGSVRRAGNRVRITAQLIDTADGSHLWADRFDRDLEDVFIIQDEIAQRIVAAIPRRMEAAHLERVKRNPTANMAAYDLLLRGKDHHFKGTYEDNDLALQVLDRAIELDPGFAQAYAWKACTLGQAYVREYRAGNEKLFQQALRLAEKSRELDDDDSEGHRILCEIHLLHRRYDQSELHHERAYALNPNDPRIVGQKGQLMTWTGRAEEAVHWLELARRLDPYPPDRRADSLGQALFTARRYQEAIKAYKLIGTPSVNHHANLAACHAMLGDKEEADKHTALVIGMAGGFSIRIYVSGLLYQFEEDREHHRQALLRAGLPY